MPCAASEPCTQWAPRHEPTVERRDTATWPTDDSQPVELAVLDEGTPQGGRARYGEKGTSPGVTLNGKLLGHAGHLRRWGCLCPAHISSCRGRQKARSGKSEGDAVRENAEKSTPRAGLNKRRGKLRRRCYFAPLHLSTGHGRRDSRKRRPSPTCVCERERGPCVPVREEQLAVTTEKKNKKKV